MKECLRLLHSGKRLCRSSGRFFSSGPHRWPLSTVMIGDEPWSLDPSPLRGIYVCSSVSAVFTVGEAGVGGAAEGVAAGRRAKWTWLMMALAPGWQLAARLSGNSLFLNQQLLLIDRIVLALENSLDLRPFFSIFWFQQMTRVTLPVSESRWPSKELHYFSGPNRWTVYYPYFSSDVFLLHSSLRPQPQVSCCSSAFN